MSKTYTIYLIPGIKVGCTDNLERRSRANRRKYGEDVEIKILAIHTDLQEASMSEIFYQNLYDFGSDGIDYLTTLEHQKKSTEAYRKRREEEPPKPKKRPVYSYRRKRVVDQLYSPEEVEQGAKPAWTPILQYSLEGEFIREWPSLTSAAKELGLKRGTISACLKEKIKSAYGFVWKYKEFSLDF